MGFATYLVVCHWKWESERSDLPTSLHVPNPSIDVVFSPAGRFLVVLGRGVMILRAPSFEEVAALAAEKKEVQTP